MGALEPWHLIIILVIVVVLFGAGRLTEVGGALGKGIREFKDATTGAPTPPAPPAQAAAPVASMTAASNACPSCGTVNPPTQNFCGQCGAPVARTA